MIHTASLVHDDVLDDCDTRRGEKEGGERMRRPAVRFFFFFARPPARAPGPLSKTSAPLLSSSPLPGQTTVNSLYGTRVAVLAGDFLFAQSSWFLANLDNLEVIKLISQVRGGAGERERGAGREGRDTVGAAQRARAVFLSFLFFPSACALSLS